MRIPVLFSKQQYKQTHLNIMKASCWGDDEDVHGSRRWKKRKGKENISTDAIKPYHNCIKKHYYSCLNQITSIIIFMKTFIQNISM